MLASLLEHRRALLGELVALAAEPLDVDSLALLGGGVLVRGRTQRFDLRFESRLRQCEILVLRNELLRALLALALGLGERVIEPFDLLVAGSDHRGVLLGLLVPLPSEAAELHLECLLGRHLLGRLAAKLGDVRVGRA